MTNEEMQNIFLNYKDSSSLSEEGVIATKRAHNTALEILERMDEEIKRYVSFKNE